MGVYMIVQAFESNDDETRTVRNLFYTKNDDELSRWFAEHLDRDHLDYGPYYEFNHYIMNELIVEYELALNDKGAFANHPGITKEECLDIIKTLKEYRKNRGDKYSVTYFLYSQS